ncbi:type VII secretion integral membrane protein EccD [Mycolicibacterium mageritense]|uniref:type VII secretion integral membrane protein EccD n=1 Tax=Mycolicibacterium mageritense TaxID=53462 RepID=UPI001E4F1C32|nr:type VII secretion integral membrane protein EccD [Mycolicibacterium mageritense]MCC9184360.1 type VII secretion integral membrane protein EccD [Mycolicibacterium mageritense]
MTAVQPRQDQAAPAPHAAPRRAAAEPPASCRVTLLVGESEQIDLVLPAEVELADLIDPTIEEINRILVSRNVDPLPDGRYELARAAGLRYLASDRSLAGHGIVDGNLLVVMPAGSAERYESVVEQVSTALARWSEEHFTSVSERDAVTVGLSLAGVALGLGALLVWRLRWASSSPVLALAIFAGLAVVLGATAYLSHRTAAPRPVVDAVSWSAVVAIVAAGAVAPPGTSLAAPNAFLAGFLAIMCALVLGRFSDRYWVACAALATAGLAAAGAAGVRMFWDVPGQRIAVVVLLAVVIATYIAPRRAAALARVPHQRFSYITGKDITQVIPGMGREVVAPVPNEPGADITLRGEELAAVARRSNRALAGVLLGIAITELAASWAAIQPGTDRQWPFIVVTTVVALVLIMRARGFRDRRHASVTVVGAALSLMVIPLHYGVAAAPQATGVGLTAAGIIVGIALAGLIAGAVVPRHRFSEPIRELVEYLEYVLAALVFPFAAWAIELFQFVRFR